MKVCLIGHFKDDLDEGVRNVSKSIFNELKKDLTIKKIDIKSIRFLKELNRFKPDIIHFVLTPTLSGLILVKITSILNKKSKTIVSAVHPTIHNNWLLKLFNIDLILTQSRESQNLFESAGFKTKNLPNGVNINKFSPVNDIKKTELRSKYKISKDKFVILHLASLKKERNLEIFMDLQKNKETQVLIIGRENENFDKNLVSELKKSGCLVWIKHFHNIDEIYNLSDCYVFPTFDKKACIETPLSILEAMSCNLPIITTKFGSIPSLFPEKEGLFFIEKQEQIIKAINKIKLNNSVNTRELVLKYSWNNIGNELKRIYTMCINS